MIVVIAIVAASLKTKKNRISMVSMTWVEKAYEFHVRATYFP